VKNLFKQRRRCCRIFNFSKYSIVQNKAILYCEEGRHFATASGFYRLLKIFSVKKKTVRK